MPLQKKIALWVGVMMSCAVFGQRSNQLIGLYLRTVGCVGCGDHLSLKSDSTFTLRFQTDFVTNEDVGTWKVEHKTLFLFCYPKSIKKVYKFKIKKTITRGRDSVKLKDRQTSVFDRFFSSPTKRKYFYKREPISDFK